MKLTVPALFCILAVFGAGVQAATLGGTVQGGKKLKKTSAVVYLTGKFDKKLVPMKGVSLDQIDMEFKPHVLPITKGTTVDFLNSDEVRHNVYSPDNEQYNLGSWPKGQVKSYTFRQKGVYTQLCNVHPEMESFIVVLDTPYFALTDRKGRFEIKHLPPGEYTVRVWHEKLLFKKQEISINGGDAKLTINRR